MPNFAYWLSLETWTLTQAVFLGCGEASTPEQEGERRTAEHNAHEAWIKASKVSIIDVPAPTTRSVLTGQPHPPRMTPGVRVEELMAEWRAQTPIVWGRELIKESDQLEGQSVAPADPSGPKKADRQADVMRRLICELPRDEWSAWRSRARWHAELKKFDAQVHNIDPIDSLFNIAPSTFRDFWKNRPEDLKQAVTLKDKSR